MDDAALLARYAQNRSEEAFAELVRRHLNLVYSAALRQVGGDAHFAQDVAQSVFSALASKAGTLSHHPVLTGWLYTTTHFTAAKLIRTERRRKARELEAQVTHDRMTEPSRENDWSRLRLALDDTMQQLSERDREAILLRYFENRRLADIGTKLGVTEGAAGDRVERALERLRTMLVKRGITSSSAALAVMIESQAVIAAPSTLAAAITSTSLASGAATGIGFFMSKISIVVASAMALAGIGAGIYEVRQARRAQETVSSISRERDQLAGQLGTLLDRLARADQRVTEQQAYLVKIEAALETASAARATTTTPNSPGPVSGSGSGAGAAEEARLARAAEEGARRKDARDKISTTKVPMAALDTTYQALYRQLNLSAEQISQFRTLATENAKRHAELDQIAATQGLKVSDPSLAPLYRQTDADFDAKITGVFGTNGQQAIQHFAETMWIRSATDTVAGALFYTDSPLTANQANQLVEIVWDNMRSPTGGHNTDAANFDAMAIQAQAVLSEPQLSVWRRMTSGWKATAKK